MHTIKLIIAVILILGWGIMFGMEDAEHKVSAILYSTLAVIATLLLNS